MERHPQIEGFCSACKPADRRPPWQWCEQHVHVDDAVQCAAKSSKTQTVKERMGEPTLAGFGFDGMPFYCGWSGSKARLQSKPIRWLFCDEVRNYGRCNTTSELEEIRKQLKVPLVNAMIDTGFKASEVYRFCLASGWKAMKGDDAEWFLSQDPRTKKTVRRVWRRVLVDPTLGARKSRVRRHLPLFQWSNPSIKDHLALFTHGVVGQWTLPKKTGRDYVEQMTAEVREEREDSRGRVKVLWIQKRRDNHHRDCELMIDVAAIVSGHLKSAATSEVRTEASD